MKLFTHTLKHKAKPRRKTKNSGLMRNFKKFQSGALRSLGSTASIGMSTFVGSIIAQQFVKMQAKRLKLYIDTVVNECVVVRESELHATDDALFMADNAQMHHIAEHRAAIMQCVIDDVKYRVIKT